MTEIITVFDSAKIGVYQIVAPSGKMYIGMTCESFANRWSGHHKNFRLNRHHCPGLLRSYKKYGNKLKFEILESWDKPKSKDELKALGKQILLQERYWWNHFRDRGVKLYNSEPTGTGSIFHSPEQKKAIAETQKINMDKKV